MRPKQVLRACGAQDDMSRGFFRERKEEGGCLCLFLLPSFTSATTHVILSEARASGRSEGPACSKLVSRPMTEDRSGEETIGTDGAGDYSGGGGGGGLTVRKMSELSQATCGMLRLSRAAARLEPGRAAVRIRHHPGARRQRARHDKLAPLEIVDGARQDARYPHDETEQAHLQRR